METGIALLTCMGSPVVLLGVASLLGFISGKITAKICQQINPNLSSKTASQIVLNWTLLFGLGGLVGGLPIGSGISTFLVGGFTKSTLSSAGYAIAIGLFLFGSIAGGAGSIVFLRKIAELSKVEADS